MRLLKRLLLPAAVLLFAIAFAQKKSATIAGSVKDANTKAPLIEAVITVSSQSLKGKKFFLTDSTGFYHIPGLSPGLYTLRFEMEGFRTFTKENIQLTEGMSLGVSMEMARDRSASQTRPDSKKKTKRAVAFKFR